MYSICGDELAGQHHDHMTILCERRSGLWAHCGGYTAYPKVRASSPGRSPAASPRPPAAPDR
eukprot:scaffold116684_cov57-Phaeocystis_antarctica.AAC.1